MPENEVCYLENHAIFQINFHRGDLDGRFHEDVIEAAVPHLR